MHKIQHIIHYIVAHFNSEPKKLSKVKLAKILWFCEREFMYKTHKRLSDIEFVRMPFGPVPKKYDSILKDMEEKGIIHSFEIVNFQKKQKSFHSLKEPDLSVFSTKEISIIDSVIYGLKDKSASMLTKISHDTLWEQTKDGEALPVESVFLKDIAEPNEADITWAKKVLKQKGYSENFIA